MLDSERWNAVMTNDRSWDGRFFYGVKSTGIFCRPSCASKAPNAQNVVFFDSRKEAEKAGFRPCKRCRPDLITYDPAARLAEEAKAVIDRCFAQPQELKEGLNALGVTRRHLTGIFERQFNLSPEQYVAQKRVQRAKELLDAGCRATDAAFAVGLGSSASFAVFFKKQTGISPKEYIVQRTLERPSCFCETPLGRLRIEETACGIAALRFADGQTEPAPVNGSGVYLAAARAQLSEYFSRRRRAFDIPLSTAGSVFQEKVWSALREIPYGETRSYQQIAEAVGNRAAVRAVGMANNRNPIPIIIPCHRVVGKDGKLVGYAGGLDKKQYLLELESASQH